MKHSAAAHPMLDCFTEGCRIRRRAVRLPQGTTPLARFCVGLSRAWGPRQPGLVVALRVRSQPISNPGRTSTSSTSHFHSRSRTRRALPQRRLGDGSLSVRCLARVSGSLLLLRNRGATPREQRRCLNGCGKKSPGWRRLWRLVPCRGGVLGLRWRRAGASAGRTGRPARRFGTCGRLPPYSILAPRVAGSDDSAPGGQRFHRPAAARARSLARRASMPRQSCSSVVRTPPRAALPQHSIGNESSRPLEHTRSGHQCAARAASCASCPIPVAPS